jgi:oligoribonuclease NrnB/cAMP/cGMP phosphodiesterase (DHH superfamily)
MKFFVWSDFDLDGTGSILLLKWAYPDVTITFKNTKVNSFRDEFIAWCKNDSIDNYDRVFFLDLDVSKNADLMDHEKSVVMDHHLSHVENKSVYKKSKVVVEECTSCVLLMYKKLKGQLKLTEAQKKIVIYIDDYDCYKHQVKESLMLNYLFTDLQRGEYANKVERFIAEFKDGFHGFTPMQLNIIKFYQNKIQKTIDNCDYFEGEVNIQKKSRRIKAAITDTAINDVCEHILNEGYDLAIAFNPKTGSVSFRTKQEDLDVSKIAEKLCGGGGHQYAAGGKASETFAEFTKLLKKSR